MFRFFILIFGILNIAKCFSQDTLFLKTRKFIAAKISEVNTENVIYRYTDSDTAFRYTVPKSALSYIKYWNGVVDSVKTNLKTDVGPIYKAYLGDTSKIELIHKICIYKNEKLSNRELKTLILRYPYQESKNSMLKYHRKMQKSNLARHFFGIYSIAPLLIGVPLLISSISDKESISPNRAVGGAFTSIGVISFGLYQTTNYLYHKRKKHIIATYNSFQ